MGEGLGNIVEIDQRRAEIESFGFEWLVLLWPRLHAAQAATERLVDKLFQLGIALTPQPLKLNGNVVFDGQSRSHASTHSFPHVAMSTLWSMSAFLILWIVPAKRMVRIAVGAAGKPIGIGRGFSRHPYLRGKAHFVGNALSAAL